MPATSGKLGFGVTLQMDDGTGTYTTVAELTDIVPPRIARSSHDMTRHDSPGGWREFIAGIKDPGEFTATVNWIPADPTQNHVTGLWAVFISGVTRNFKIIGPASVATITFAAFVTRSDPTMPLDNGMKLACTFRTTGAVTITTPTVP